MKANLFQRILLLTISVVTISAAEHNAFRYVKDLLTGNTPPTLVILAHLQPAQRTFIQRRVIPAFEKKYNCRVYLQNFINAKEIKRILQLDALKNKSEISLVLTPFEITKELVENKQMLPLKEIPNTKIQNHMEVYHPIFKALGQYDKEQYFIPRMVHTQTLFYRKSKVADAVSKFESYRNTLQEKLNTLNGYGLPANYTLEKDPNEWDFYDLFTIGYIWSREEYFGRKTGRIAHRSDRYLGTALHLIDRAYQLGATSDDVLAIRGDAVSEMFLWEQVFAQTGIYNKESYQDLWRSTHLFKAIKDDNCFLTWLSPHEFGRVHGWENDPTMKSYMSDPNDMGVAFIPQGVSFTLLDNGEYKATGSRNGTLSGEFWGIPKSAPQVKLAFEFATYITNRNWNAQESSNFCMLPVRRDLIRNIPQTYSIGWLGAIMETTVKQIAAQVKDTIIIAPRSPKFSQIAEQYVQTYLHLVQTKNTGSPADVKTVEHYLHKNTKPKVKKILGEEYPQSK